ncbi:recombinase family protein [Phytoactinopolyspora endophytica]|uniref:recombinase family protein n=1 Tax=Phytoactinopolyspora endophytica TaxID=1642495 RepID=UPI00101B7495|nr:recombinase family protein [Phytoactinopolyspora endophytica]
MATTVEQIRTGREYLRVSVRSQCSIDEQAQVNRADAATMGVTLGKAYVDNGFSASSYRTREREDYGELIADLESGQFSEDALFIWETSRGSREVEEWGKLLRLLAKHGKYIRVSNQHRYYDPSNHHDRRWMYDEAIRAEAVSDQIRDGVLRSIDGRLGEGKGLGASPYGYESVHESVSGRRRVVRRNIVKDEADRIKELFEHLDTDGANGSFGELARQWDGKVYTRTGKPFTAQALRNVALNPAYAGFIRHPKSGELIESTQWEPIVDYDVWLRVQNRLSDPSRRTRRPGPARYPFAGVFLCDVCGSGLTVGYARHDGEQGPAYYRCRERGCVSGVDQQELDDLVDRVVVAYLSRPDVVDELTRTTGGDEAALREIRTEMTRLENDLRELGDAVARGRTSMHFAMSAEEGLNRQLKAAQERERELSTPSPLRSMVTSGNLAQWWKDADVRPKREAARVLLSEAYLGEVRIGRKRARNRAETLGQRLRGRWAQLA